MEYVNTFKIYGLDLPILDMRILGCDGQRTNAQTHLFWSWRWENHGTSAANAGRRAAKQAMSIFSVKKHISW